MRTGDRIKFFLESKKIDASTIYKKIGTDRNTWSGWVNDGRPIKLEAIKKFIEYFPDINARWLITGEGEMLNDGNPSNIIDGFKITEVGCPLCNPREREIITQNKLIALLEEKIKKLESSQNKKPTEKIGYKKDEQGIDKAAETTGKYKVTNLRQLKLNANLSDRVD